MKTFEEYLENLRETVKREPKDDAERGFQTAVMLIYEDFKIKKSIDKSLADYKSTLTFKKELSAEQREAIGKLTDNINRISEIKENYVNGFIKPDNKQYDRQ